MRMLGFQLGLTAATAALLLGVEIARAEGPWRPSQWVPPFLMLGVLALFQLRMVGRALARAMTYQLTLGPNVARVACQGMVATEVMRSEVTRLVESARYLCIHVGSRRVVVPRDLGGYDEVRARLAQWRPVETSKLGLLYFGLVVAEMGLWLLSAALPLSPVVFTGVMVLFVAGPIALTIVVRRTPLTIKRRAQIYALSLLFVVWAALRVWLAWAR